MRILVTGGAGFLGTNLCESLLEEGHIVTALDNYSTGRKTNNDRLIVHENFDVIEDDICTWNWHKIKKPFDQIYNLASPASPVAYQAIPIETWMTNTLGTYNIIRCALEHKATFLQTSTSEVYGDPDASPQKEDYPGKVNCYGMRACYDEGKRAAEALIYDFQRVAGLDARIVRIFNTYGPFMDMNDGRVISNFIVQALKGKKISIYGDGSQTRSFMYVSDNIAGLKAVMQSKITTPMNLGNPEEFTMLELAEEVIKQVHIDSQINSWKEPYAHINLHANFDQFIQYHDLPVDDPKQRCPDIRKIKYYTKWRPTIKLDEGLKRTIEYFKREVAFEGAPGKAGLLLHLAGV